MKAVIFLCFIVLLLAHCNSAGDDSEVTTDDSDTPEIPANPPELAPESLVLVNELRARGCICGDERMAPAPPLRWNADLLQAALQHASDMDRTGFLSHTGPSGSTPGSRAQTAGYEWRMIAENIAAGQPTARIAVESWINSPGHCRNLMNPDYEEVGVANVGKYWVQVFGSR